MHSEWIIDVLADLKAFAEHNGMDATAAGLEDASLVAIAEISSLIGPRAVVEGVYDALVDVAAEVAAEAEVTRPDRGHGASNVTVLFAHRGSA